jgi:hypothetical protein
MDIPENYVVWMVLFVNIIVSQSTQQLKAVTTSQGKPGIQKILITRQILNCTGE